MIKNQLRSLVAGLSSFFVTKKGNNTIDGNLYPSSNGDQDIGSATNRFNNIYANNLIGVPAAPDELVKINASDPISGYLNDKIIVSTGILKSIVSNQLQLSADFNLFVPSTRVIESGNGLTGGGHLGADRTLAVGAGTLMAVDADTVGIAPGSNFQFIGTGSGTAATWRNVSDLAGSGLDHQNGVLAVGAGTLITVGADTVGIAPGSNFQFIGTGSGTAATWRNVSDLAGSGLDSASGVLAVGVANTGATGLSVESNAVRLTSNSNPGATAAILASDANGGLGLLRLTSNSTFTSGFAGGGYRIDEGVSEIGKTSAEFDNLTVRGRMRIYELLIQQIRATNGSMFVSSSSRAEVVTEDNDWYVNGELLELNDVGASFDIRLFTIRTRTTTGSGDRNLYHGFLVNDILRAQRVDIGTGGGLITRQVDLLVTKFVDLWEYVGALVSSDAPVVGDEMVRLGSTTNTTRQGSIYLTSDDSNAPFIDIVDEVASHAEWNQVGKIKARLGRLSGIVDDDFDEPVSGYGLYSDNVYLKGKIVSTSGAIGGWTLSAGALTSGTGDNAVALSSNGPNAIWAGAEDAINALFRVDTDGYLFARSGRVGGWNLGFSSLTGTGTDTSSVGLIGNATGSGVAIYAGDATPANAPFKVTAQGALTATSATITGAITATSGMIDGVLTIGTGGGAGGGIYQGSGTFASPTTGLKLWNSSGVGRIAGYNGGTLQWEGATDGTLKAGAGAVTLDANGVQIQTTGNATDYSPINGVQFMQSAASMGGMFGYTGSTTGSNNTVTLVAENANRRNRVTIVAQTSNNTSNSQVSLAAVNGFYAAGIDIHVADSVTGFPRISMDATEIFMLGQLIATSGVFVDSDSGGKAGTVGLTDVSNTVNNGAGTGTIKMKGATNRTSAGFVKIYIGTTAYWVPVFDAITG